MKKQQTNEFSHGDREIEADERFQAVVIGAGHAGAEAALALARTGIKTLLLSINLDSVAYLACNPSIGGTAKGHLVREVDALGGEIAVNADKTLIHLKMLNESKGVAVQSLRAQVDKYQYHSEMKKTLENTEGLCLKQAEVLELITENRKIAAVRTASEVFSCRAVIVACGVYLNSEIITGSMVKKCGPNGFECSTALTDSLIALGIPVRRFKTGTPARIDGRTIDYGALEEQRGAKDCIPFSHMTDRTSISPTRVACHLGYTTERTKEIVLKNLHLAPMYSGKIKGTGARYCPSIEDKIVRFADKEKHQFFLEPEGLETRETYVQGISTSLPLDVQRELYRSLDGMANAEIMRPAYAIEYDCIDPMELSLTLEHKRIGGLFFAGQVNGTSGYEEAAAQGIVAGLNASLKLRGKDELIIRRNEGYIGVLIDDLVTKGTNEPYRMMSSRAEYRLVLRQDNADSRLTQIGYNAGLVAENRYKKYLEKKRDLDFIREKLEDVYSSKSIEKLFIEHSENLPANGITLGGILRRGNFPIEALTKHLGVLQGLKIEAIIEAVNETRYEGYIKRQNLALLEAAKLENKIIPKDFDYFSIGGLRIEARQKLDKHRPLTLGQASRISGVSPADINVLVLYLRRDTTV